jgi:ubiquinone/menaquinone biosynthesis C-methylase UbiE
MDNEINERLPSARRKASPLGYLTNRQDGTGDVSSLLKNIYRCAEKSSWYDSVAAAYDRTRPRYSAEILSRMQEIADLKPGKSVLEIGAGVGIATVELARLGAKIVCVEPSQAACAINKKKCAAYDNVEVITSTFEDWQLPESKFDLVVAATSFHWVTPEVRYVKTAKALNDHGLLVLLWNTPPQLSYEIHQGCQTIYQTYAPELIKYESHQEHQHNLGKIAQLAIASGYFQDLVSHQTIATVNYSVEEYLTLLSTLSPYIRLAKSAEDKCQALFMGLDKKLRRSLNQQNQLELSYLSMMQTARKTHKS